MKLHFEPNLDYQLQAVEAVCDLFRGQETCRTEFTVTRVLSLRSNSPSTKSPLVKSTPGLPGGMRINSDVASG